jgi:hypothetical protein
LAYVYERPYFSPQLQALIIFVSMKRLLFLAAFLMSLSTFAQYQWDYGLKVGGANYLGDIGGKELTRRDFVWDMHLKTTNIAI